MRIDKFWYENLTSGFGLGGVRLRGLLAAVRRADELAAPAGAAADNALAVAAAAAQAAAVAPAAAGDDALAAAAPAPATVPAGDAGFRAGFLSRRRFLRLAAGAVAAAVGSVAAGGVLSPYQAQAVTAAEKQAEANALRASMDAWNAQLDQYSSDYYDALDAHAQALSELEAAEERLDAALARQAELQERLAERARTMYKRGPLSYLDVLFGSSSYVEFATSWDMMMMVAEHDVELLLESQALREEAEAAAVDCAIAEQLAEQKLAEAEQIMVEAQALMEAYEQQLAMLEEEVRLLIAAERAAEEEFRRSQAEQTAYAASLGLNPGGFVPYTADKFSRIVELALSRQGCPYVWAATGPDTFDCSGLTYWCYSLVGTVIARGGNAQYHSAPMRHSVAEAMPGDILYKPGHVGLYLGDGLFIHAPFPGDVVRVAYVAGYGWWGAARW